MQMHIAVHHNNLFVVAHIAMHYQIRFVKIQNAFPYYLWKAVE